MVVALDGEVQKRWEFFLRLLREAVAQPTEEHPVVRCWKSTELISLIGSIVNKHRKILLYTFPTAKEVVKRLTAMGWLRPVSGIQSTIERLSFFFMEMDTAGSEVFDPLELLQAYLPSGVICYLGALSIHELTTQTPCFFHVGRIRRSSNVDDISVFQPDASLDGKAEKKRNALGTEIFRFDGAVCYKTNRYAAYTPGVQMRIIAPRTWLRTTTLEQTLLDTLMQPVRCGGEAVVFEAWERGLERYDTAQMAEYLEKIGRRDLWRRVGAMLDILGAETTGTQLDAGLKKALVSISTQNEDEIPLLHGLEFSNLNKTWRVAVP